MSEKGYGSLLLLALVAGICALALFGPAGRAPHRCKQGAVETLFTDCEKVTQR